MPGICSTSSSESTSAVDVANDTRSNLWLRVLPAILLIVAVGLFYWWQRSKHEQAAAEEAAPVVDEAATPLPTGSAFGPLEQSWVDATGSPPEWPEDFGTPSDCAEAVNRLRALTLALDDRGYVRDWQLPSGTFGLVLDASRELGARPPVLGFRLTDGSAVRANVTYLVRVLGARRVVRLARLATEEPELGEPLALAIYQWLQAGDSCAADARPPSEAAQYAYASFLLQTIGGQGYLRRRAPRAEALASFYGLLIADAAVARGYDPQGVELLPEIRRCRALVETQPLVFRDRYLEQLGEMQSRWEAAAGN